jgi:hypothetical protein
VVLKIGMKEIKKIKGPPLALDTPKKGELLFYVF